MPRRLAISLKGIWSRRCQRLIIPSNATSITPIPYSSKQVGLCAKRASIFDANYAAKWVSFRCKSTGTSIRTLCPRFLGRNDAFLFPRQQHLDNIFPQLLFERVSKTDTDRNTLLHLQVDSESSEHFLLPDEFPFLFYALNSRTWASLSRYDPPRAPAKSVLAMQRTCLPVFLSAVYTNKS